ncbi:MAG: type II toxin-antitoxin system RelE/ParE family toxin [Nitrospirae bacterium]|nr:type II toxin-antitoxin system RelE/ParE family toxin [Magnetococcales bacterium]
MGKHPLLGRTYTDLALPPVRFLHLSGFPYIIVYDATLKPPVVLRFLHGARDLPEILKDL